MHQQLDGVLSWLRKHQGQQLSIQKFELASGKEQVGDQDRVRIQLERVTRRNLPYDDPDGYLSPGEVVLHGNGEIMTAGSVEPLPQRAFEIPFRGEISTQVHGDLLEINTLDTVYTIKAH
jgi:hypothetical protein